MLQIDLDTSTYRKVLAQLRANIQDATPLMAGVAQELRAEANMQLKEQAGPAGAWVPLSPATLAMRQKRGNTSTRMLQVTGQLASSLQSSHDHQSATLSTNKPYAAIHQFGGKTSPKSMIPGKSIPARAYLPIMGQPSEATLSDHAHKMILAVVTDYLERHAKG
jgi:phage virion morphogenesis protein